jgi:hypothetical protein
MTEWQVAILQNTLWRCSTVNSRETVPAQPVDATPANRLIGQHFSQGTDLSELYSIKPKQDSVFRPY